MDKITVTAIINTESKKAWNYYTNPKHIVNWNFADASWHCPKAENDMRVGGKNNARMEAKDGSEGFDFETTYTEISDGKEFTVTFGGRTSNVKFEDLGNQTKVIVTFDPETENPIELQRNGWQAILNNYKNYTESN